MNDIPAQRLRELATIAARRLQSHGFIAYWAGGCVRDILLGITPKDYDIATNAVPDRVIELFPGSIEVGKCFGVIRAPIEGIYFEIATFRQDSANSDGRRPDSVTFSDPQTDAERRDFTINAMFMDPITDTIHDLIGGQKDLSLGIMRFVGAPEQRIREDHLRMLRAARFASTLGFVIEDASRAAIIANSNLVEKLSVERIRDEFVRTLLEAKRPGQALVLLDELGLLDKIMPEVVAMKKQEQPPAFHPEGDVFTHTVIMLDLMEHRSQHLSLAALLHDVGKPGTARQAEDRIRFDGHDELGATMAQVILKRLRFSTDDIDAISTCIGKHMRMQSVRQMRPSTLRKLIGAKTFPVELELHRLDCLASHGDISNYEFLVDYQKKMASEPILPPPWITGHDIMSHGIQSGPEVGKWRKITYDLQLEAKYENREALLRWMGEAINESKLPKNDS